MCRSRFLPASRAVAAAFIAAIIVAPIIGRRERSWPSEPSSWTAKTGIAQSQGPTGSATALGDLVAPRQLAVPGVGHANLATASSEPVEVPADGAHPDRQEHPIDAIEALEYHVLRLAEQADELP